MTALSVLKVKFLEFFWRDLQKWMPTLFVRVVKFRSSRREVLKRHLVEVFFCTGMSIVNDTGAWSLIIIEWIVFSEIC